MKELIIHAGRHKTGTTSIQRFLALNYENLLDKHNILYPLCGRDKHHDYHHQLFERVVINHEDMDERLTNNLKSEIDAKPVSRIIVSSEMLSRKSVTEADLFKVKKAFSGFYIKIVIYLRRQDSFLRSEYAERVRRGILYSPDNIYNVDVELDYFNFIEKFSKVFGKDSIKIRVFEDAVRIGIYKDLLYTLNVDQDYNFKIPEKIYNKSWPWLFIEVVRRLGPDSRLRKLITRQKPLRIILYFSELFPQLSGKYKPLSEAECRELMDRHYQSNLKLATEYLNRRDLF